MGPLAVVAQGLPVVSGQNDEGPLRGDGIAERIEEPPQDLVRVGDLSVIELLGIAGEERLGRRIGIMGIVKMDPEEPGRLRSFEPSSGPVENGPGPPLPAGFDPRILLLRPQIVVVDVESAAQAKTRVERKSADKRPGGVARCLELGGQGRGARRDDEIRVVVDSMGRGRRAEQDVDVGRKGRDRVGVSPLEDDGLPREPVDIGGQAPRRAQDSDPVGTKGIDRDEQDVRPGRRTGRKSGQTSGRGGAERPKGGSRKGKARKGNGREALFSPA